MKTTLAVSEIVDERPLTAGEPSLWQELEVFEKSMRSGSGGHRSEIARFGKADEYVLRLAVSEKDRLACWNLVYREYLEHGYTQPQSLEYRYSLHDALPETATFLVETSGRVAGTVSVFPDSPLGLPADEMYRPELDALRGAGRKIVEIGRLTIAREFMNERLVLMTLFDALSTFARCLGGADDLVITVNPSHAKFYERMILFDRIGDERSLGSVCQAPAVLLRLDLAVELQARRWAQGEGAKPDQVVGGHTAYQYLSGLAEETRRIEAMERAYRKPDEAFIRKYFVCLKPLIQSLPSPVLGFFDQCYPGLASVARPTSSIAACG